MSNFIDFQSELDCAREVLASNAEAMVELRPLPAIAVQVNKACASPDLDTRALADLVECDPIFSSKILSAVNSSMYGFSREVSSVQQACVVLGRKDVAQLAISIATQQVFSAGDDAADARMNLYEHSLGCASVGRTLANCLGSGVDSGAAFLAGMLHDVGKLILLDVAPKSYPLIMNGPMSCSRVQQELENYGTDHMSLGVLFGNAWNLSAPIRNAIACHHDEEPSASLTKLIVRSNRLSKMWGIGQSPKLAHDPDTIEWLNDCFPGEASEIEERAQSHFCELKALLVG